jgi:cysteinyl-tRNA synthetase
MKIEKELNKLLAEPREKNIKELFTRLMQERDELRTKKDYKSADEIRESLLKLGVQVKDKPEGSTWQYA